MRAHSVHAHRRLAGTSSAGFDPSGRVLLLTLPRAENGAWPINLALDDDGQLRLEFKNCTVLAL